MRRSPDESPASRAGSPTPDLRDWTHNRDMWARRLEASTGLGVAAWLARIAAFRPKDAPALRAWLETLGVTGYAQTLLVMEKFGYPDFLRASAEELIAAQYADRPALRPVFDAVVAAAHQCGPVVLQARKTYVSLLTPRRTFARIQPTTRTRVDVGLRLDGVAPVAPLLPSTIHETMKLRLAISHPGELDAEARRWLERAYRENC